MTDATIVMPPGEEKLLYWHKAPECDEFQANPPHPDAHTLPAVCAL